MLKKGFGLIALILLAVPVLSGETGASAVEKQAGYTLIDAIGQTFHEMAMSGSGGVEKVNTAVEKLMAEARKAKEENRIDGVFFSRYARILAIIKVAVAPDPEGILVPMFDDELRRFVREVLGEDYKTSGPQAIGQVANAIADELINLHLYLDNIETKEKLRKAWDEKMSGPAKKEG
ncbi:MAG: hypothetical protein A2W03_06750 [Candidatus Aminicenantes bacterium RBG_16_63_16]|nr:MAG: hypothetical protein A2W03_06750 [Candidatus Aminicenantes bacterium RBG_16_63_16]